MALVKYNNNSISAITAAASIPTGAMNLITTNTISSGVSSSSFTSSIDSTYDTYMFKFINIHPATDGQNFTVNFRDGSTAFDATKTTTLFQAQHSEGDASPSSTTFVKHFISEANSYFANDKTNNDFVGGYCNVTAAIDGVDFKFASGNIDSGVIKMYGLSKS